MCIICSFHHSRFVTVNLNIRWRVQSFRPGSLGHWDRRFKSFSKHGCMTVL